MKRILLSLLTPLALAACEAKPIALFGSVAVSFSTESSAASPIAQRAPVPSDTAVVGSDTLIVQSVEVVLREIELEPVIVADCDVVPKPPECEEIEFGPVLVNLPLTPGATQEFDVNIPPGSYVEIEFEVHKPDDTSTADSTFLAINPEFADTSIRVRGTFNGTAFSFTTDLTVEQELTLSPPLDVIESASTNLTIFVDISTWFKTPGAMLVDPTSALKGGTNENLVRDNIIASFRAFEDRDGDGDDADESG